MPSPFVRRRRLADELRTLREKHDMTAEDLSRKIFRSRTTISKLENARCRPDVGDVMKILQALNVTGDEWRDIVTLAGDAADRGWWDAYGNTMGARQRMYADIESDADTIRGYYQVAIPGILQTPDYTWALVDLERGNGPVTYKPERMVKARLERQRSALRPGGPTTSLLLDEFLLRRLAVPAEVMSAQLRHLVQTVSAKSHISLRVLPVNADIAGGFFAKSPFSIYTFPDVDDPPIAVADTVNADIVHAESNEVTRYVELHRRLSDASLSAVRSLGLLEERANELDELAGL